MIHYALYALLSPESEQHLQLCLAGAPMPLLPTTALFITDSSEPIETRPDAVYVAKPRGFMLKQHPFTGNPSLLLLVEPDTLLLKRRLDQGAEALDDVAMFMPLSDRVDMALPRMYKNWLNSTETMFMRENFEYEYHSEFLVEHNLVR